MKKQLSVFLFVILTLSFFSQSINLISPQNESENVDIKNIFRWSIPNQGDYRYRIYVSESENLSKDHIKLENIFSTFYAGEVLKPNTKYFWKVEAYNSETLIESEVFSFTTRKLEKGDMNIIFFGNYDFFYKFHNFYLSFLNDEIIFWDKNVKQIEKINLNEKIINVFCIDSIFIQTEKSIFKINENLEISKNSFNEKILKFISNGIFITENGVYNFSNKIIEKKFERNNLKNIINNEENYFLITNNSIIKLDHNFKELTINYLNENIKEAFFIDNKQKIVILTDEKLLCLNSTLEELSEIKIENNSTIHTFSLLDKIAVLENKIKLIIYDSTFEELKSYEFRDKANYVVPINNKSFITVGEKIRAYNIETDLLWQYGTINNFEIIRSPQITKDGLLVSLRDFIVRQVVFYEEFEESLFYITFTKQEDKVETDDDEIDSESDTDIDDDSDDDEIDSDSDTDIDDDSDDDEIDSDTDIDDDSDDDEIDSDTDIDDDSDDDEIDSDTDIDDDSDSDSDSDIDDDSDDDEIDSDTDIDDDTDDDEIDSDTDIDDDTDDDEIDSDTDTEVEINYNDFEFKRIYTNFNENYVYDSYISDEIIYIVGYEEKAVWNAKIWKVLTNDGEKIDEFTFGGNNNDFFRKIILADYSEDSKVAIAFGDSSSFGINGDAYLVAIDEHGEKLYDFYYGDTGRDNGTALLKIDEESFVIGGNIFLRNKMSDIFVSKYTNHGTRIWTQTLGGRDIEMLTAIKNAPNQGFMIIGATRSFGYGNFDIYAISLNFYGNEIWSNVFGNEPNDIPLGVFQNRNSYYILYETHSENFKYGIVSLNSERGFLNNFEKVLPNTKILNISQIENDYYALGYEISENSKKGVVYKIDIDEQKFQKVYELDAINNFEIMNMHYHEKYFYFIGNITEPRTVTKVGMVKIYEENFYNQIKAEK